AAGWPRTGGDTASVSTGTMRRTRCGRGIVIPPTSNVLMWKGVREFRCSVRRDVGGVQEKGRSPRPRQVTRPAARPETKPLFTGPLEQEERRAAIAAAVGAALRGHDPAVRRYRRPRPVGASTPTGLAHGQLRRESE